MTDEPTLRHEVDARRAATTREWEVFVRETERSDVSDRASGEAASREAERSEPSEGANGAAVSPEGDEPLTHVGSVSAPSKEIAVEQAERLFGHAATALWLCPADEVVRRTTADRALAER